MGISFKVSKTGTRFRPKPPLPSDTNVVADDDVSDNNASSNSRKLQVERKEHVAGVAGSSMSSEGLLVSAETEASFTLNLFPDGYSIGKPSENENAHQDVPKLLHPYDRTSETLFSAIESGRLPGDILDDIPCKYIDGTLVCEVRDYRKCALEQGPVSPPDGSLIVNKVRLRMSLENVVKDIPLISDNSWSYGDLMEVESRILKALQPQLHLDPTPMLDRLCKNPVPTKLDLALTSIRRKRLRQMPEVTVTSNSKTHGKKVCIDRVPENSNSRLGDSGILSGNLMPHYGHENLNTQNLGVNNIALRSKKFMPDVSIPSPHLSRYQIGVGTPRNMQDHGSGPVVNASASSGGQEMMILYADNVTSNASHPGKREHQDGQISPLSFNKRSRSTGIGLDAMQHQQIGPIDNFNASDMNWKNTLLQQPMAKGMQYPNTGTQKFSPQVFEGALNQDGGTMPFAVGQPNMRYVAKEEQFETGKVEGSELSGIKNDMQMVEGETSHLDLQLSRFPQRLPQHPFMRSNYSQTSWNNLGQNIEKDARKDDQFSKRKSVQSPRLSGGVTVQSPLSSKSADFSSGFVGPHFGVAATSAFGVSQKEKPAISSAGIGTVSLTSSGNGSMHRQHQAHFAAKRKSNSLPKTSAMSGVGSPASVSNISMPLNANSPSVGTPSSADESMLERLSKITQVTMRYQLNGKKNKVDNYSRKPNTYPAQHLMACLSNVSNNEDFKDDSCVSPLSKSLVGGSMNICKTRILNFVEQVQGAGFSYVPKAQTRTIMSEKPNDGTVAIYHGEIQDSEFLSAEEFLPTLPNTHLADLLAAQFCSLMVHDGYTLVEDHVQPKPTRVYLTPGNDGAGLLRNNSAVEMQQYADAVSGQPSNDVKPMIVGNASLNPPQNLLPSTRMLPPGNPQAVQMSQGLLSGTSVPPHPQQLDSPSSLQQQQQQQHHQQQQQHHQQQQQQQQQQMQQHQQHQPQQTQRFLIQQQHPQHPQLQRSMMLAAGNPLSQLNAIGQTSNVQLGNLVNKLPLQYIYQQQQQQQPQMQRKMMMGLGSTMAMGTLGNNMVGISGLGNAMGMGAGRGIAGAGMSAPMTPISGMGNVAQNQMNALNQQRIQALMTTKLRMQNRGNILGVPQTSIAGMSGARQMHPGSAGLSMLGQARNRANMSPMQQAAMAPMGPPKLMQGMNIYMNSQQQQQQKQQQQQQMQMQQQQLQQQLQQQQPQQQDTNSPLQAVLSPPQVSSPSTMGIPQMNQQIQQQASPQQMSQRTPMSPQLSSGAIHAMSAGNPEGCPASPQLSSQTHGSVGSIANSPMDLQAANNSAGNA